MSTNDSEFWANQVTIHKEENHKSCPSGKNCNNSECKLSHGVGQSSWLPLNVSIQHVTWRHTHPTWRHTTWHDISSRDMAFIHVPRRYTSDDLISPISSTLKLPMSMEHCSSLEVYMTTRRTLRTLIYTCLSMSCALWSQWLTLLVSYTGGAGGCHVRLCPL